MRRDKLAHTCSRLGAGVDGGLRGPDVAAYEHPWYRPVYLRLMPADGSARPRVIAYVYGGQGTINVPSWSPDSQRLAFVSNTDR